MALGRDAQPSRFMPSAIAPLLTMMTSRPSCTSCANWLHHRPMASASRPRPSSVTRLEPTLTTMRLALTKTGDKVVVVVVMRL